MKEDKESVISQKSKWKESYKLELVRNGSDAAEKPSGVKTGEAIAGFSYENIFVIKWNSGGRNQ